MLYKEVGFRALYKQFCVFPITDNLKNDLQKLNGPADADSILTYGYIDSEKGLQLEMLAFAKSGGTDSWQLGNAINIRYIIQLNLLENEEFFVLDPEGTDLVERYQEKLEVLASYSASEEVETSRTMNFLDEFRDKYYPDIILVDLVRDGYQTEKCWARIYGLGEHWIMAILLDEPHQDFGFYQGSKIAVFMDYDDNGNLICWSNMNPDKLLTEEDLADGTMLKNAIATLQADATQKNYIEVMSLLHDSTVWIPCTAVLGETNQKNLDELIEKTENPEELVGLIGENTEDIRFIPDVLTSGEDYYFPIFSSAEEMGEYGEYMSKIPVSMHEAIAFAQNNEKDILGIVVNAFTDNFILPADVFDLVEQGQSRLVSKTEVEVSSSESDEHAVWLVSSSPYNYPVDEEFREHRFIDWEMSKGMSNFKTGDTVYVYISSPVRAVHWRCHVEDVNYFLDGKKHIHMTEHSPAFTEGPFAEIVADFEFDLDDLVTYPKLKAHGVNSKLMGPEHVKSETKEYLEFVEASLKDETARETYYHDLPAEDVKAKAKENSKKQIPPKTTSSTEYYRDPYIAQYAKNWAKGKCQLCGKKAPFKDKSGNPYLESHHIIWLSQGGEDSIKNVVSLCPNCHRKMHVVADTEDVKVLLAKVKAANK